MSAVQKPSLEEYIKTHPVAAEYAADMCEVAFTEEELDQASKDLAARVSQDYRPLIESGEEVVLIGILKGCVMVHSNLLRYVTIPVSTEFLALASYEGTESTGKIILKKDVDADIIAGKHVIVVEDLIDTGNTLKYAVEHLQQKKPASLKILALLDKPARRTVDLVGDYVGLECPNKFVVGYGMDFNEKYRNIPFLGVLKPEIYKH